MRRLTESSAFDPPWASDVRSCDGCERRDGRYPLGAPTVAIGLAGRLRCDARSAVVPRNSLHSLRSLRSNSLGESDERSALRAPTPALALQAASCLAARPLARHKQSTGPFVSRLAFSPPHKSPPPGTAHRAAVLVAFDEVHGGAGKAAGGCAPAATYAAPRNGRLVAARASALRVLTRRDCPSAANAVSAASFATGHEAEYRREPFAQRRAAAFERRRIPAHGFASMHGKQVAKRWSH